MSVYNLVFLALLATSGVLAGLPQHIPARSTPSDESLPSETTEGEPPAAAEDTWPDAEVELVELVALDDQNPPSTPESHANKAQDREGGESAVWKIALVVAVLLVFVLGCVSMAYYLCVWRGGRVHYQPQKEDYA